MEVQVEESNNHKEKSKEKIENGSKYEMTSIVPCGMIMLLWSEYNIFELVGWEGSAHDSCVLNDTLNRPKRLQIPKDILGLKSDFLFIMDSNV